MGLAWNSGLATRLTALIALLLAIAWSIPSSAGSAPTQKIPFNIPAGDAVERVLAFSLQTDIGVDYSSASVVGLRTRAVSGDYRPLEALNLMLEGTGRIARLASEDSIIVELSTARSELASAGPDARTDTTATDAHSRRAGTRRRALDTAQETITVRGTWFPISTPIGAPQITLTRDELDAFGFATVQGTVKTLPMVFGGGATEDTHEIGLEAATNPARGHGVNLRALGAGSSLLLINGHRLAPGGSEGAFVDVSSVPLSVVSEIAIIPESTSIRYGAGGVGGTVSLKMLDDFDGAQSTGHFGSTTRGDVSELHASQILGGRTAGGAGLMALEFYERGNLAAARRAQVTSDLTKFGAPNFDLPIDSPGTLFIAGRMYALPKDQDGKTLDAATLVPDTQNLADKYEGADILPRQSRWSFFGTWTNTLTDGMSVFTDALFSRRNVTGKGVPAGGAFAIPDTNPFIANLAGHGPVTVLYRFRGELGPTVNEAEVDTRNVATGLNWRLGEWRATGTVAYASETLESMLRNTLDRRETQTALADPNPATALNLFGDGSNTNALTLERLRTTAFFGSRSYLKSANLTAEGPSLSLPGGELGLAVGAEFREESFVARTRASLASSLVAMGSRRAVKALFAEAALPFWSERNRLTGLERLNLSLGMRYEEASDLGGTLTPRFGLEWSPIRSLTLRSSWTRSLRTPSLADVNESHNATQVTVLPDSTAPGGRSLALLWVGKNADLRAETARSWTAGVDFKPARVPGLTASATYFDIDFTDRLTIPVASADLLTDAVYADLVTRNPTQAQITAVCSRSPDTVDSCQAVPVNAIVDLRMRNDASVHTRGVDVVAKYVRDTSLGEWSAGFIGTYLIDFLEAKSRQLTPQERVSTQNYPMDLRFRGSVGWKRRGLAVNAFVNYSDQYRDTTSAPVRTVTSLTTVDANVSYTFGKAQESSFLGETELALNVENLFGRDPRFLSNAVVGIGYDEENGDALGRVVSLNVWKKW